MSLDSVVFAQKSCFKTKHQKSFFTLLTQVYVGFVPTWLHVFPLFPSTIEAELGKLRISRGR